MLLGWTPATFVSSRSDRAKKQAARPEDFMDEEDLQDLKDSQKLVDETEQMDFLDESRREGLSEGHDDLEKECVLYHWLSIQKFISSVTVLSHEH